MDNHPPPDLPLPVVAQPQGLRYYLGTWSGRLILINFVVFVLMTKASDSMFMPTQEVLLQFGAKDPVLIAHGEYWRFLTPVFVHIGVIHFLFNSMGIYYVGYQLETLLGSRWFLLVYLLAGIGGNVSSSVFSLAVSAGASGALFGLLGSGFLLEKLVKRQIERTTGHKPRQSIYASMVIANLILGVVIPGIDNAAHMGGMVCGILATLSMLYIRRNRLLPLNPRRGVYLLVIVLMAFAAGGYYAASEEFLKKRYFATVDAATNPERQYYYLSEIIRLQPMDPEARFRRGQLLIKHKEKTGLDDLEIVAKDFRYRNRLKKYADEIESEGLVVEAAMIRRFIKQAGPDPI